MRVRVLAADGLVTAGQVTAGLVTAGLVTGGLVTGGLVTGGLGVDRQNPYGALRFCLHLGFRQRNTVSLLTARD